METIQTIPENDVHPSPLMNTEDMAQLNQIFEKANVREP